MTELPKDWDTCSKVVISAGVQLWINNCVKINIYPVQVSCPCPSTALPQTWQLLHHCHFSGYCFYFCYYCICFTVWVDWLVSFGLEQDGGGLISPMALAHPLHPIDSRSRNRCRNLWVGWYIHTYIYAFFIWVLLFDIYMYIYIYIYIVYIYIYIYIYIQQDCRSALVKLHPITFCRTISGECAVPGLNVTFCFLWFTNLSCSVINSLKLGCLWLLVFVSNNILILDIWRSAFSHLPGCIWPWTFL